MLEVSFVSVAFSGVSYFPGVAGWVLVRPLSLALGIAQIWCFLLFLAFFGFLELGIVALLCIDYQSIAHVNMSSESSLPVCTILPDLT